MFKLKWDQELAEGAKRWAEQCNFSHDSNREVCRFPVGQNLYIEGSSRGRPAADWKAAITSWYSEVDLYTGDPSRYKFSSGVGHFTQVMDSCFNKGFI